MRLSWSKTHEPNSQFWPELHLVPMRGSVLPLASALDVSSWKMLSYLSVYFRHFSLLNYHFLIKKQHILSKLFKKKIIHSFALRTNVINCLCQSPSACPLLQSQKNIQLLPQQLVHPRILGTAGFSPQICHQLCLASFVICLQSLLGLQIVWDRISYLLTYT